MPKDHWLILLGASTRAAAFSARRAGLLPCCADLFADVDLAACCQATRVAWAEYPDGLERVVAVLPAGPWLYTGALENRPELVARIAARRSLWGNSAEVLRRVRDPFDVATVLGRAGLPCPRVRRVVESRPRGQDDPSDGVWLVKPLAGTGGRGIRERSAEPATLAKPVAPEVRVLTDDYYEQQFVAGVPCAALYVAAQRRATLLGLTRQLVGEPDLHAKPFHYCGSIGPLPLDRALTEQLARLGTVLAAEFGVVGLFGVDGIVADGVFWPVEINPRYTASVEVLELALGLPLIALHRDACRAGAISWSGDDFTLERPRKQVGKAILFAPSDLVVTDLAGRLRDPIDESGRWPVPRIADVPHAGERIAPGRPICTVFAVGGSVDACRRALCAAAREHYGAFREHSDGE